MLERISKKRTADRYYQSGNFKQTLSKCFERADDPKKQIFYFKTALKLWETEGKLRSFLAYKHEELADLLEDLNRLREAWDARRYADDLRTAQ